MDKDFNLPVPVPNLDGQPADIRSGLDEVRHAVSVLLLNPEVSTAKLASAYGEMGGLYQESFLRRAVFPECHAPRTRKLQLGLL